MKTVKIHTKTDLNGNATINVDTSMPNSELDLTVLIEETSSTQTVSENKQKYDLSEFVGKIQWNIDPLDYQRKLRDEW